MSGFEISIVISEKTNTGVNVYTAPLLVNYTTLQKLSNTFMRDGNNGSPEIQKYIVDSNNNISNPETVDDPLHVIYKQAYDRMKTGGGKKRKRKTRKRIT